MGHWVSGRVLSVFVQMVVGFGAVLALAGEARGQFSYELLHAFTNTGSSPNQLIQGSDGNLYGTAAGGGASGGGTVFRITTAGVLTTLHSFDCSTEGCQPVAGLVRAIDGTLFGTTYRGGATGQGTVFRITTDGAFTTLHSFDCSTEGCQPVAALVLASDGHLYGTTQGTVFRITTAGDFTTLHSFACSTEGCQIVAGLVQASADGNLYGTAAVGGASGGGTVFRITTAGAVTTLHSFACSTGGCQPVAGLVEADGKLYGTTEYGGGASGGGTVFSITTAGDLTTLHSFVCGSTEGCYPQAGLVQASDGNLYGTTEYGGASGGGTVFSITTAGTLFATLHSFNCSTEDCFPLAGLVQASDGNLYGTFLTGGASGQGTVFSITTSGTLFTTLHSFGCGGTAGCSPEAGLVQASDGNLYGTTREGGASGGGTVFRTTAAGVLTTLHSFDCSTEGCYPVAGLVQASDGNLYGTTSGGGASFGYGGTVFKITTAGAVTTLRSFNCSIITEGCFPYGGLVQASDGKLYGTTNNGGAFHYGGTVFRITTAGTLFATLKSFDCSMADCFPEAGLVRASDGNLYGTTAAESVFKITVGGIFTTLHSFDCSTEGCQLSAGLVQASDGNLYGTTRDGGAYGGGIVFRITTAGALTTLHSFDCSSTEGCHPEAGLARASDGTLYGTTRGGGASGGGTVFRITTAGALTTLHSFNCSTEGCQPVAGLVQASDGSLYGTTSEAGPSGGGTVFRMAAAAPKLTVTKVVVGGAKGVVDFPLFVDSTPVTSGDQITLTSGLHTVSETSDASYAAVISGDCAAAGTITLAAGDVKSCTITNTFQTAAPKLTVTKVVVNTGGGTKPVSGFPLFVDGLPVTSGNQITALTIGSHTVSETSDPNYTSAITGDCAANGTITLAVGDVKSCTITNTFVPRPDLIVSALSTTATTVALGGTLSLSNTVKNQGTAAAGLFVIAYHLSSDATYGGTDDVAFPTTRSVTSLGVGATSPATTTLTVPAGTPLGTYRLCAMADSGTAVLEMDETNNSLCTTDPITVAGPDLVMAQVQPGATSANPGGTLTVSNTVQNTGGLAAAAFTIAFRLSVNTTYDADDVVISTTRLVASLAAGASSTVTTTSLAIPLTTPPGTYYVCAKADSAGVVTETNEGNNTLCSAAPITVAGPDLVMTQVVPNAGSAIPGGTLSVTNTVQNAGALAAGAFAIAFRLSLNTTYEDGNVVISTTRLVASLAIGASSTVTTTSLAIPLTTLPGTYHVCAKADSAGVVSETNEGNNTLCSMATITVTAPDLIVTALSTTTTAVAPGGSLTLSNTVKNQGGAPAGAFLIAFSLSPDAVYGGADIAFAATRSVLSLAGGASSAATTTLTVPAATPLGTYYICAQADSGVVVTETNEGNNTLCSASTVTVGPDLIMTALSTTTTAVAPGGSLTLSNTVKNQGGVPVGTFLIAFSLSPDAVYGGADIAFAATRSVSSLAVGASSAATTTLTVPTTTLPGTYYICAQADSGVVVTETNEGNNTLCSTAPIRVGPDLIVTALSTTTTAVAPGGSLTLSNTVKNQGGVLVAGAFLIAFSLSPDAVYGGDDTPFVATRSVSSLAVGASSLATTTLTVPPTTSLGTYHLCAIVDSGAAVLEADDTNNSLCTVGTITVARPDLIMTQIQPNAASANPGGTLSVSNTVQNAGGLAAGAAFTIAFRLSLNTIYEDPGDVVISTTRVVAASLAAGASSTVATTSLAIPLNTPAGTYHVCAKADSAGVVTEGDETNNTLCSSSTITVP